MSTAIYYDLDRILPADIARAVALAEDDAVLHIRRADALWPKTHPYGSVIDAMRVYESRMRVVGFSYRLREGLGRGGFELPLCPRYPVDVLDVAHYEWIYALERDYHLAWALAAIIREHQPRRLVLATDRAGHFDQALRRDLASDCRRAGTELFLLETTVAASRYSAIPPRLKYQLYEMREDFRHWIGQRSGRMTDAATGRPGGVLFAEFYPNSSRLAAEVADAARAATGENISFLAGRIEVRQALRQKNWECILLDEVSGSAIPRTLARWSRSQSRLAGVMRALEWESLGQLASSGHGF